MSINVSREREIGVLRHQAPNRVAQVFMGRMAMGFLSWAAANCDR
jgi:hypothetical protein